jgi:D-alanine-D-alanine ligase
VEQGERLDRAPLEFKLTEAVEGVLDCLPGAVSEGIVGDVREVLDVLERYQPDVVFNCCEAPQTRPDLEPHVAALFEWLGVRFTGAGSDCLALCRRKDRVNPLLAAAGIAVPRTGGFPCIVKPADEDGSFGVWTGSICENAEEVERAHKHLQGHTLVEEFLPGREFVVALWGEREPEHVSVGETLFQSGMRLRTYFAKWHEGFERRNTPLVYDSPIAPALRAAIVEAARGAWHVVGAHGYLTVDVRLDAADRPHVLDVNPNPEIAPGFGMHRAVREVGWQWPAFVLKQIEWARC